MKKTAILVLTACVFISFFITTAFAYSCYDPDGGINYYVKSAVEGVDIYGIEFRATDECENIMEGYEESNRLMECYCTEGSYECVYYECPKGCENGACIEKCAKEGEYTSGPVSPAYQYDCCEGLQGYNTRSGAIGGGLLCYNPEKGIPVCKAVGTISEGWYYPSGELLRYDICGKEPCIEEGGTFSGLVDICCEGLIPIYNLVPDIESNCPTSTDEMVCVNEFNLGNGRCDEYEYHCNVPEDCYTCHPKGHHVYIHPKNKCCHGLEEVDYTSDVFMDGVCFSSGTLFGYWCFQCGNDICEEPENPCLCPEDCSWDLACIEEGGDLGPEEGCSWWSGGTTTSVSNIRECCDGLSPVLPEPHYACQIGICKPSNCTDSDGGKDYYTKGLTTGNKNNVGFELWDTCEGSHVNEYYCTDDSRVYDWIKYECPDGCVDGRCVTGNITVINGILTVATIKNEYLIDESVELSDPPENEAVTISPMPISSNNNERDQDINGYIIQFKEKPVLEYREGIETEKQSLEDEAEELETEISSVVWYDIIGHITNVFRGADLNMKKAEVNRIETDTPNLLKEQGNKITNLHARITSKGSGYEILGEFKNVFSGIALDISYETAESLKSLDYVKDVFPNRRVNITLMDSVPLIKADEVWKMKDSQGRNITGEGITIAIIDTGIDYTHPDLGGCFGTGCKVVGGYDIVNDDSDPMDDQGHGTHCAGIAAGNGVLKGVAPDAELYSYKVLDNFGGGWTDGVIAGIDAAVDPNGDGDFSDQVDVMSLSLGGWGDPDDPLSLAIDNAVDAGVVAVIAAGNRGPGCYSIDSPGTSRKAITVGATDKQDNIAYFSSRGPTSSTKFVKISSTTVVLLDLVKPDILAPGVSICSAQWDVAWEQYKCLDDDHTAISGTSMATPHVAGAAALLKQANPDWSPDDIKYVLRNTAVDIGEDILTQGHGRIDISNAIKSKKQPIAAILNLNITNGSMGIIGTAKGTNYTIYYGVGIYPSQWVEIANGNSVENDILALWDVNQLSEGTYTVRLVVESENGVSEDTAIATVYKNIQEGWPVITGPFMHVSPIIADLDNDGQKEVIFESGYNYYVIHSDGSLATEWGWPKPKGSFAETITVGDLDKDGTLEIIIARDFHVGLRVFAWYYNGTPFSGWSENGTELIHQSYLPSGIALEDITNDGNLDILVSYRVGAYIMNPHWEKGIFALNNDGSLINGWPVHTDDIFYDKVPPTIGDIDGDGYMEILITDISNKIYAWNHDGSPVQGFPVTLQNIIPYPVVLGDIDKDNEKEIIVCVNGIDSPYVPRSIYILNAEGSIENNWQFEGIWCSDLALGNIDDDEYLEIIMSGGSVDATYAWNHDGSFVNGWPVHVESSSAYESPVIGDVDGDGKPDVLVRKMDKKVYAYKGDGTPITGWPRLTRGADWDVFAGLALGDLDGDGDVEVVVPFEGGILAWDLPGLYQESTMHWPMFQHNPRHTGCYDCEVCGNGLVEGGEQCDGENLRGFSCLSLGFKGGGLSCTSECTLDTSECHNIKSMINNTGGVEISGYLLMKVEKFVNGSWVEEEVVVDDLTGNTTRSIAAGNHLALDTIWSGEGGYTPNSNGSFRVYVGLLDSEGDVLQNPDDSKLEDYYEFEVV